MNELRKVDPEIAEAILHEIERQAYTLEMIASENFVPNAILQAQGCVMTNKYAEGYPGKRYYGGCQNVDIAEDLARERAKKLFNAEHANVQPHSGTQANMAVYFAFMEPGDTLLGMNLSHGGHLSHGHPVNFSGRMYKVVQYGVDQKTETIDYDALRQIARECKPKIVLAGASAYPRIIDFVKFREIADEVGAIFVMDMAHIAGLIAAGVHPNPNPIADVVTTTTHKTLRGPRSGTILCKEVHAQAIDKMVFPGCQGGPLMHIIAAKAVCFKLAMTEEFKVYQGQVVANAKTIAEELKNHGFDIVSGGTDTHLLLVNLTKNGFSGKKGEEALEKARITVNKNTVPFDTRKPFVTSGIRIGTPALTTRGMKENEMRAIASFMVRVLKDPNDEGTIAKVSQEVLELCKQFPIYEDLMKEFRP